MEHKITIPVATKKLIVEVGMSVAEIDLPRFCFGDGEWVVTIHGEDVFS